MCARVRVYCTRVCNICANHLFVCKHKADEALELEKQPGVEVHGATGATGASKVEIKTEVWLVTCLATPVIIVAYVQHARGIGVAYSCDVEVDVAFIPP